MYAIRSYYGFPVYLTLVFAVLALVTTLNMEEPDNGRPRVGKAGLWELARLTLHAGRWILHTPMALAVITSYSIHYTKLYEPSGRYFNASSWLG